MAAGARFLDFNLITRQLASSRAMQKALQTARHRSKSAKISRVYARGRKHRECFRRRILRVVYAL